MCKKYMDFSFNNSLCLTSLWLHTSSNALQFCLQSNTAVRGRRKLTVPTVQEFSDDGCAAGRPGAGAVYLDEGGRHHVVVLQFPKHVLAGLHVVVWHVEHVSCREGM